MTIGNCGLVALKDFRRKHQLTQHELADMLEVDQSTISFLENGRRKLDPTKVKQVSEITGISKHDLRPDLFEK
ncbi:MULTISPECIES: helix-turn-helix transcriptional regulator [Shewanella]|jgi:transcriptional regulator with XRE-family HTH domain|uniref:helix-turn-helix transcriptional regulator n=1 Tax=Shewanella TaxID=22 RepID=UPI0002112F32|nr:MULTISPECIES: helix-turn-helix transcriptional regulator [Shewanella]AEH16310.1 helix-turn-helix domain protein [Shewanella baltica OS117]NRD34603.1 helix-turn-helix transcriptional regulator [Shewanella sp. DC2-4]GCF90642.1 hypothetical protein SMBr_28860 [Shewanella sp. M-Br]